MSSIAPYVLMASEAEHGEPAISIWTVGGIVLAILLVLLLVTVAIGGGRDHS